MCPGCPPAHGDVTAESETALPATPRLAAVFPNSGGRHPQLDLAREKGCTRPLPGTPACALPCQVHRKSKLGFLGKRKPSELARPLHLGNP